MIGVKLSIRGNSITGREPERHPSFVETEANFVVSQLKESLREGGAPRRRRSRRIEVHIKLRFQASKEKRRLQGSSQGRSLKKGKRNQSRKNPESI